MKYRHNDGVVFDLNSNLYTVMSAVVDLSYVSGFYPRDTLGILVPENYSGFVVTGFNKVNNVSGATIPKLTHFNLPSHKPAV
jgi:hypothetical protein